jgi:1-acyl-sn-glycerol-3-phosphate acyltransferase
MPGDPRAVSRVHARPTLLYRVVATASRPVVERIYRLRVRGLEHVPERGGFVVAANHTSNLDPWPLGIALWPRSLHFMAKHEVWKPPLKWIIAGVGSFPVRRGEGDVEALEKAMRVCREGRVMAMFPEGTGARRGCTRSTSRARTQGPRGSRSAPASRSSLGRCAGSTA